MAVHKPESFKCNPFGGATWIMRSTKSFISCGLYLDKSLWYFHNLATAIKKCNSLCPVMSPAPSALLEKNPFTLKKVNSGNDTHHNLAKMLWMESWSTPKGISKQNPHLHQGNKSKQPFLPFKS